MGAAGAGLTATSLDAETPSPIENPIQDSQDDDSILAKEAHTEAEAPSEAATQETPVIDSDPNREDDLKKIEGIGPKVSEILKAGGIKTFSALAAASIDRIKAILADAGPRYTMMVPDTWPEQAGLARDGKWDELEALQDILDGGKRPS